MEVLPCSGVQYVGESDCPQQSSGKDFVYDGEGNCIVDGKQVHLAENRPDDVLLNMERPQLEREGGAEVTVDGLPTTEGYCNGASYDSQVEGQRLSCGSHGYEDDDANAHNYCTESSLASENCHLIVDTIESELPNNNRYGESSLIEPTWLEGDESVALWVKVLFVSFSFHFVF